MTTIEDVKSLIEQKAQADYALKQTVEQMQRELAKGTLSETERKAQLDKISSHLDSLQDQHQKIVDQQKATIEGMVSPLQETIAKLTERADNIEAMLSRPGMGGSRLAPEEVKAEAAAIVTYDRARRSLYGTLNTDYDPADPKTGVQVEDIKAWFQAFPKYLRMKPELAARAIEHKALLIGSDPDGGYVVPPAISNRIITRTYETTPMLSIANVETIGTNELHIPRDEGEFGAGWIGEVTPRTETATAQFGATKIPVHEWYAWPIATQQFLEDAAMNVEAWISNKVSDKSARLMNDAYINGNGITKPRGFLTYAAWASAGVYESDKLEQVKTGHATQLTAQGLINLVGSLPSTYSGGARFMFKRTTSTLIRSMQYADGRYVWNENFAQANAPTILGQPVTAAEDMPAVASGTLPIAYGNFREGYTIVNRLGLQVIRDIYTKAPWVVFKFRGRTGGDVVDFSSIKLQVVAV